MLLLYSHGEFDVMHGGREYVVFCEGEASTEYLCDEVVDHRQPAYRFRLTGAHGGPPIEVLMVEPPHSTTNTFSTLTPINYETN